MKKFALVAALAIGIVAATGAPQEAQAKDMAGRFGVGADSTLGWNVTGGIGSNGAELAGVGNKGLSVVYYITKMFGLQLILGSTVATVSFDGDKDTLAHRTGVGFRALVPIAFTNEVNLTGVVGFSGVFQSTEVTVGDSSNDNSVNFISFDLGLRPEWFITDHFSIHTQVGISIALINEDHVGDTGSGVGFDIFGNADLLGDAGFTFWF